MKKLETNKNISATLLCDAIVIAKLKEVKTTLFFQKEYLNPVATHDDNACQALKEYERLAQFRDASMWIQGEDKNGNSINLQRRNTPRIPPISMSYVSMRYGVTVSDMKTHWRCIEK